MLKEKVCVFGCVCVSDWVWYLMAETPNVGCFQWVCKLFVLNSCPFRLCHSNALGRTLFFFRLVWPKNLCKLVHSFPTFYLFFLHSYALFFSPPIHIYTFYVAKAFPCFSHFIFNWNMCKFAFEVSHHHLLLLFSPPFLFLLLLLLWVTLILFALTDNNNIGTRSGCSRADERWKKSVSRIVLTGNDSFETDRRLQKKSFHCAIRTDDSLSENVRILIFFPQIKNGTLPILKCTKYFSSLFSFSGRLFSTHLISLLSFDRCPFSVNSFFISLTAFALRFFFAVR